MSESPHPAGAPLDAAAARPWVQRSLARGALLSHAVASDIERFVVATLLAPVGYGDRVLDDVGRGIRAEEADATALAYLTTRGPGGGCLVVEDDLARPVDPGLGDHPGHYSVVDGRILRWADLEGAREHLSWTLRAGSSRFPLNAFVLPVSASRAGLMPGAEVGDAVVAAIARQVVAVIVSVFDAEAYVALAEDRAPW
ncbi:MAG TPA: hypothetical protein VI110_05030 [Lapillicoccus sp.]